MGDLHGCYELLEQLLEEVAFNKTHDRLFSVGDLIDRGPNSLRCLDLLAEPWFYAVQGNHEFMMIDFFMEYLGNGQLKNLDDINETGFLENGGDWIIEYFQPTGKYMSEQFNRCLAMVLKMPQVLVVGEGDTRFHVIHAELVRSDHRSATQMVWLDSDIDRWLNGEEIDINTLDRLYWGRKLMSGEANNPLQIGLATTFCGHTVAKRPRKVFSHLCIDTGAFLSLDKYYGESGEYGLTLYDVKNACWFKAAFNKSTIEVGTSF